MALTKVKKAKSGEYVPDHRDLELLSEAFAMFVRMWFAHAPRIREEAKREARDLAENRYKQFVQHVAQEFSGGRRFL